MTTGSATYLEDGSDQQANDGFSLVELIVVVVILGILAAVAIPILSGIENKARENALLAVAAEAAVGVATDLSNGVAPTLAADTGYKLDWAGEEPTQVDQVCVRATRTDNQQSVTSGPGC